MPITKKKNGKYQARFFYRDDTGQTKSGGSQTFDRKRDAQAWLQQQKDKFNIQGEIKRADMPFVDFWMDWFTTFKKPSLRPVTADKWLNSYSVIKKYWKKTPLKNMDKISYQRFINWYGQNHAKTSVEKVHVHTHAAIKAAYEDNYIDKDFALRPAISGGASKPDALKYLEQEDFLKLIDYLNKTNNSLNMSRLMIQMACYSGARLSEIAGLTIDDIDPLHGKINIDKTFDYRDGGFAPTKNPQSIRQIDIEKSFLKQLQPIINEKKIRGQKLIFAKNIDGCPPSSNGVNKELRSIFKKIGIKKTITFHGLRHTHISYLLANGVDIQYVSKRAGHSSVMTTLKIYTHILQKHERHEVKRTLDLFAG